MKYIEVKKILEKHGFELEGFQTSGNLDMLSFWHPNIKGEIRVDFNYDVEAPQDILDGREFNYKNENETWLMEWPISSVIFDIDKSISYMSSGVLDTCGASQENEVDLFGEDLYLVEKVIKLMVDPMSSINFQQEYNTKVNEFYEWVKIYTPIIEKYGLIPCVSPTNGNESTIFKSFCVYFYKHSPRNSVNFDFTVLSWHRDVYISLEPGLIAESGELGSNPTLEEFETELSRQLKLSDEFYERLSKVKDISA